MAFSYAVYRDVFLIIPGLVTVFMVVTVAVSFSLFLKKWVHRQQTIIDAFKLLFCLSMVVFCTIPQIQYLANGGIYLLKEKEGDALVCTGMIESVCEPSKRFPGFKSFHQYGADIVIGNEQYFAVTCETFKEGDYVTIYYLPNSHFVLSIEKSENAIQSYGNYE